MGTWGHGPFDNAAALDFVGRLTGTRGNLKRSPARALSPRGDHVEDTDGVTAIAAAAVIACADGLQPVDSSVAELLAFHPLRVTDRLRALAEGALDRVSGPDSEWRLLWEESGELPEALARLDLLREALRT